MLKDIVFVEPVGDYRIRLRFEDGAEGIVDITEIVSFDGVFSALKDKNAFNKVRLNNELGTIKWENGADLDPDVLYSKITGSPIPVYPACIQTK